MIMISPLMVSPPRPRRPLVSRTSILILGGVLIGLTSSEALNEGLGSTKFFAFLGALVGLLAFIGLEAASARRRRHAEQRAQQEAAARLEQRVNRHLLDETSS